VSTTFAQLAPDGFPDDRVTCGQCAEFRRAGNYCAALRMVTWGDLPLRCTRFVPIAGSKDRRTGLQRWPALTANIESARALDRAHAEKLEKERA
jgi:hypothetical protein